MITKEQFIKVCKEYNFKLRPGVYNSSSIIVENLNNIISEYRVFSRDVYVYPFIDKSYDNTKQHIETLSDDEYTRIPKSETDLRNYFNVYLTQVNEYKKEIRKKKIEEL